MISFDTDIKPLFRQKDVVAMKKYGAFDLHSFEDVKTNSNEILKRLQDGTMPCDGAWQKDNIDKFNTWIQEGMNP
ncbi:MAG: hypothetical protein HOO92_13625 [Methylococcaceae bacterium]|nr:hypothetical protein [Methylococcaceae bacterium]